MEESAKGRSLKKHAFRHTQKVLPVQNQVRLKAVFKAGIVENQPSNRDLESSIHQIQNVEKNLDTHINQWYQNPCFKQSMNTQIPYDEFLS